MMPDDDTIQHWLTEARNLGAQAARNAATWVVDGNTERETIQSMLTSLLNCDLDLPNRPNLSGEFADSPTPITLWEEVTGSPNVAPEQYETLEAIIYAWEEGVNETFETAVEEELRIWL